MSKYEDRMKDYITVDQRVLAFYKEFPKGSIQSEITHLSDKLVVVKAWAYRDADDSRPGVGHSSMNIPGSTPFTRGSEVENAETSAWGRAIAALGFEVRKGIATREEIENKADDGPVDNYNARITENGDDGGVKATRIALIRKAKSKLGDEMGMKWLKAATQEMGTTSEKLTIDQMLALSERISKLTPQDDDIQPPFEEDKDVAF